MSSPRDDHSWAYALKPGDKAAIASGDRWYGEPYTVVTFSRATATQFIFDEGTRTERRVNKSNMRVRGASSSGRVEPCTQAIESANLRYRLSHDLAGLKIEQFKALDLAELQTVHSIVFNKVPA